MFEVPNAKRQLEGGGEEDQEELWRANKLSKVVGDAQKAEMSNNSPDLNLTPDVSDEEQGMAQDDFSDALSLALTSLPSNGSRSGSSSNSPIHPIFQGEIQPTTPDLTLSLASTSITGPSPSQDHSELALIPTDQSSTQLWVTQGQAEDHWDLDPLISPIGRDLSLTCLLKCSRSDYGTIASLNKSFLYLMKSGELYKLRRQKGVIENWIYFSCNLLEWEAFDPVSGRWMHLPRMPSNECFMFSDKESLAVGTELLVFGKGVPDQVVYRYSILKNSWTFEGNMNAPRCLFGSASLGEKAILAGGSDSRGRILSSAELYNSETRTWTTLPSMHKPRKMCSAVFMDKKFYVIGGIGGSDSTPLTCGEEYDLATETWTEIPNMSPGRNNGGREIEAPSSAEAPPLVAVVNNDLYAADYAEKKVRRYVKDTRQWITVGELPERLVSMNGWGLAFRACGDRLVVIGGPPSMGEGSIELNAWVPSDEPAQWNLLGRKPSGSFVYNCAVMGC